jgi:hypothetical protein
MVEILASCDDAFNAAILRIIPHQVNILEHHAATLDSTIYVVIS